MDECIFCGGENEEMEKGIDGLICPYCWISTNIKYGNNISIIIKRHLNSMLNLLENRLIKIIKNP